MTKPARKESPQTKRFHTECPNSLEEGLMSTVKRKSSKSSCGPYKYRNPFNLEKDCSIVHNQKLLNITLGAGQSKNQYKAKKKKKFIGADLVSC